MITKRIEKVEEVKVPVRNIHGLLSLISFIFYFLYSIPLSIILNENYHILSIKFIMYPLFLYVILTISLFSS